MPPTSILHYEIVGPLGAGGMGVVYKARDTRLDRFVALKFLPPEIRPEDLESARFLQEARAASALDHPNICTIHDIAHDADGRAFIVMACYEGETLKARMERGPLPIEAAIGIARQVALGLGRAHERGIVHRDIKPANIFVTADGIVKVLDFGIARLLNDVTHEPMTRMGTTIGTAGYMSPEQARGEAVDARADVWAIGIILYEMLSGTRAFDGPSPAVVMAAIQSREPLPLERLRPETPPALASLVSRSLRKDPAQRLPDARALAAALDEIERSRHEAAGAPVTPALRRPIVAIPLACAILALLWATGWLLYRSNRASWARNQALPGIEALSRERKFAEAVALAELAERFVPDDPVLRQLWSEIAVTIRIESNPSGARVEARPYSDQTAAWRNLGSTPVRGVKVPKGPYRFRFSAPGVEPIERAAAASPGLLRVDLPAAGSVPEGFVKVARSAEALMLAGYGLPQELTLNDFFIQRYEVTNRDYKKFVDVGGYRRREFWTHEFRDKDRTLSWDEAMARFRDKAGQPGPATWEIGAYPAGQDEMPVGGLSWFEAAAYAQYAGLQLPTMAHWFRAAGITAGPFLVPLANFDYRGPKPVGQTSAMSPSGAFDMAGNVKEWIVNANLEGDRYILGGGWGEPTYLFGELEARSPFDRSPQNGMRGVKYTGDGKPDGNTAAPFGRIARNYSREAPVSDDTFAQFVRMHDYARGPLAEATEKVIDTDSGTRVERVSFSAGYPNDRVIAYLWLPKDVKPPYQTLVVFPGAEALRPSPPTVLEQPDRYDFLVRSGRAVVHPIYYGMYERAVPRPNAGVPVSPIALRDISIRWSQDVRRTLDYLQSRSDIDQSKIGYFGSSLGGGFAPIPLALDSRLTLAVLMGAGLLSSARLPEVEPANFAPRVKQPLLLVGGRYDYFIPYEPAQTTFFRLIGTAAAEKSHVVVDAPHAVPRSDYLRHVLGWLDKYFGPAR